MATLVTHCPSYASIKLVQIADRVQPAVYATSSPAIIALLLALNTDDNLWTGGVEGAFKAPDLPPRWTITFGDKAGERRIDVTEEGGKAYLYAYATNVASAHQGKRFGLHPCRAFTLPTWQIETLINAMRAVIGVHRYPAPADPISDRRWRKRGIAPRSGSKGVNLRCVPSTENNEPVQMLSGEQERFIIEGDLPDWAQVVIDNGVYWINTSVVVLK